EVHLAKAGRSGGLEVVRASLAVTNSGGSAAVSVGSAYSFTGQVAYPCTRAAELKTVTSFFDYPVPDPHALRFSPYAKPAPAGLPAAGKVLGDGARLEPGQVVRRTALFYVRPGAFQVLALRAQVFAIPAGAGPLGTNDTDFEALPSPNATSWMPNKDGYLY